PSPPIFNDGIGELLPPSLPPAHSATERRNAVLVALAGLRARRQQNRYDLRAAEERRPPKSNGMVLGIEKRHVGPVLQQQPSCVCLSQLCRDMKRVRASRVRLTPSVRHCSDGVTQPTA